MQNTNPDYERRLGCLEGDLYEKDGLLVRTSNLEKFQQRIEWRDRIVVTAAVTQTFIIAGGLLIWIIKGRI